MPTLVKLKDDLEFNRNLGDIIDTLKSAALAQFRVFQTKASPNAAFLKVIEACFNTLIPLVSNHPYLYERKNLPSAVVVVTSDEGFLGELNTLLVNSGLQSRENDADELVVIGERGAKYIEETGATFVSFPGIPDDVNYKDIDTLADYLIEGYHGKFKKVTVVFPEFISLTLQRVNVFDILPYRYESKNLKMSVIGKEMEIEPSPKRVLESLIRLWIKYRMFEVFWSAKQSEYAARIMHLEGSTQELGFLKQKVALSYFRLMHSISDKTIREISASRILLRDRKA